MQALLILILFLNGTYLYAEHDLPTDVRSDLVATLEELDEALEQNPEALNAEGFDKLLHQLEVAVNEYEQIENDETFQNGTKFSKKNQMTTLIAFAVFGLGMYVGPRHQTGPMQVDFEGNFISGVPHNKYLDSAFGGPLLQAVIALGIPALAGVISYLRQQRKYKKLVARSIELERRIQALLIQTILAVDEHSEFAESPVLFSIKDHLPDQCTMRLLFEQIPLRQAS